MAWSEGVQHPRIQCGGPHVTGPAPYGREEVKNPMETLNQMLRTVRSALNSWSRTARCSALMTVAAVDWAAIQWFLNR